MVTDAHEYIYGVLSKIGYPVEFDTYTGVEKKYITYFEVFEKTDLSSEDDDEIIGHDFQVDVFSNEDPTEIKNKVVKALKENGFYQITCQDFYEKDTGMYHKAITCYLPEYKAEK